jgi:hypothetical protein
LLRPNSIDLLSLVDVKQDSATGSWELIHKLVHIDVAVRKDSITAWLKTPDDKEPRQFMSYTGAQDRLSVETDWVKLRNKKVLFLHKHTSKYAISEVTLEPIGKDAGKPTR